MAAKLKPLDDRVVVKALESEEKTAGGIIIPDNAKEKPNQTMALYNKTFFDPWESIHESNPQEILERREKVSLPPLLIMQGSLDDNMLPPDQEKFAKTYNASGGKCDYVLFENCVHQWTAKEGPDTDRARATVKAFVAKQL